MQREVRKTRQGWWGGCAAVLGLSVVVGMWNAEDPLAPAPSELAPAAPQAEQSQYPEGLTRLEKMESELAQAGCPGWMVLASEGEDALEPLPQVESGKIEQTALQLPVSNRRQPARVAQRDQPAVPSRGTLTVGSPEDPDDLLDGAPDLLAAPGPVGLPQVTDLPAESQSPVETNVPQAPPATAPLAEPDETLRPLPSFSVDQPVPTQEIRLTPPASPSPFVRPAPATPPAPVQPAPGWPAPTAPTQTVPAPIQSEPVQPAPARPAHVRPVPIQTAPVEPAITQPAPVVPAQPETVPVPPVQTRPAQVSPFAPVTEQTYPTPHSTMGPAATSAPTAATSSAVNPAGPQKTYCEFVAENNFPSAQECAKCHQQLFEEWSISNHAYAAISPMFQKFEQRLNDLSSGTVGYFCYRCHVPVGTTLGVSRATPLWELPRVVREGVTCIACHRVNQRYNKVNGNRRIEPGDIHAPVYGPFGGDGVAQVIAEKSSYKVKTSPHDKAPGTPIHVAGQGFDQLTKSEFCVSCHQVAVHPGIKLEVVWEQYRASPACKQGISCQDCHMGRIPGVPSGYETGPAAKIGDKVVNSKRKHANHVFYGPGYSIAHPGIFPHNIEANRWPMEDWLRFDWRAGWGTERFEELVANGQISANFPAVWSDTDDRYDAREIIEDNLKKLQVKKLSRQQVLENGSHVDGPYFDTQLQRGQDLKFHYIMTNKNSGHNLPSGSLGAQPQIWANVVLIGPRGQRLWESGYTDSWGDVCDIHSTDVRNKRIPYDWQLFNLQTMFLITGAKGTDREFPLPVNVDFDQLPYLRPGAQPTPLINHPPFIRMEGRSLAPLGSRKIPYRVPAKLMCEPGHYRLSFRLRSRAEPIYFMRFCKSTNEMNRAMNEWMADFHQSSVEFIVK